MIPQNGRWGASGGYREFLVLALPLILGTAAWSVQHFVDRMFLSWYSPEAIAASTPAGMLNFAVMCVFIGTSGYCGVFVAQYFGAGRPHRVGPAVWQGVYLAALGGLVMLCFIPLAEPMFNLIGHAPPVRRLEIIYFQILCYGSFFPIAASALSGFFSGLGRPWPVMAVNCLSTAINLILDYALIFGHWGFPEMGMRGAALATVISGVSAFSMFLFLFYMRSNREDYHTRKGWRLDRELFTRLMRYGIPSGVEFFMDLSGITIFVLLLGRLGTLELAATNIALNINMLAFLPMIGSGMATSILVGQYLGSDRPALAQKSAYSAFHLTFLYMFGIASAYLLVPGLFIAPFAAGAENRDFSEIFALTVILLRFVAVYSLFDGMSIIFASAIKGAGDTRFVMIMLGSISVFVLSIPTYIAIEWLHTGMVTCWLFITAYAVSLGVGFFLRFRGGKWKKMRVIEAETSGKTENIPLAA